MNKSENNIILYQDEDGITKVSVRFQDEDLWLTELQFAEIYDASRQNINQHIAYCCAQYNYSVRKLRR